jgi:phosphonate transport system substrate-binding protein
MAGSRYQDKPIYFSDVVVHRDSSFQCLADLRGASWAYNEPGSHSGYGVVRYALALQKESLGFFGRVIQSGAHQSSLAMILNREVDGSAIDSTVLEMELVNHPEIAGQLRMIDTFGPSPIPPWVISKEVSVEMRGALVDLFTQMDTDARGKIILEQARMTRFTPVNDYDYDPIRSMARIAFG